MKYVYSILIFSLSLVAMDAPVAKQQLSVISRVKIPRQIMEVIFAENSLSKIARNINALVELNPNLQEFVQSSDNVQAIINDIVRKFTIKKKSEKRPFSDLEIALNLGRSARSWLTREYTTKPEIREKIINRVSNAFANNEIRNLIQTVQAIPELSKLVFKDNAPILLKAQQSANGLELVRLLIDNGADVDQSNSMGLTPLMYAASYDRAEQARLLLTGGADPNKTTQLPAPLLYAVNNGSIDVIKVLLDGGATIDDKIMQAAQNANTFNKEEVIKILQNKIKNPALKFNPLPVKL